MQTNFAQQPMAKHSSRKLKWIAMERPFTTTKKAKESSNALSLLKYTKSYADTVGKDQFFYLDTANRGAEPRPNQPLYNEGFGRRKILTDGGNTNKISIPWNSYSYFAAFKNNLHHNIKTNIIVRLEDDANIIFE